MRVTDIKKQLRNQSRFSIYVDGKYSFSLSESDIIAQGIVLGKEFDDKQLADLKELSSFGKLFARSLNYLAIRIRSEYEMRSYLRRKEATPEEIERVIAKLYGYHYLDDRAFAMSWVENRRSLKHRSNSVLRAELQLKGISSDIIQEVLTDSADEEQQALRELIIKKRRMTRYQDPQKLLQYLVRQGYRYSSVAAALAEAAGDE